MAAALLEPMPKGALALHLPAPWGKGGATRWFETDTGVLLEAKPVAPVETTRTPRVRVVATSGGGGFGKQRRCFSSLVGHWTTASVLTPDTVHRLREAVWRCMMYGVYGCMAVCAVCAV